MTDNSQNRTVEDTLRAMLAGWNEDQWIKGTGAEGGRTCVLGRYGSVCGSFEWWDSDVVWLLDEVVEEHWPHTTRGGPNVPAVDFNDHPDTTFADVVALVEKAAALAAERGL